MPGPAQQKICPRMDTMHSFYAAAFDLDGTLLDSLGDLAEAGNKALRAFGYSTHPVDAYRHFVGSGLEMLILRALPDGEAERLGSAGLRRLVETAGKYYARDWAVHTLPYPGVCEVLSVLQTRGVPLAVVTISRMSGRMKCSPIFLRVFLLRMYRGQLRTFRTSLTPFRRCRQRRQ